MIKFNHNQTNKRKKIKMIKRDKLGRFVSTKKVAPKKTSKTQKKVSAAKKATVKRSAKKSK